MRPGSAVMLNEAPRFKPCPGGKREGEDEEKKPVEGTLEMAMSRK
jgi:hypothetical protein